MPDSEPFAERAEVYADDSAGACGKPAVRLSRASRHATNPWAWLGGSALDAIAFAQAGSARTASLIRSRDGLLSPVDVSCGLLFVPTARLSRSQLMTSGGAIFTDDLLRRRRRRSSITT